MSSNLLTGNHLLSKFQGCILGSIIGDVLGRTSTKQNNSSELLKPLSPWTQVCLSNLDRFRQNNSGEIDWLAYPPKFFQEPINKVNFKSSELAVASLPIVLFFHDQPSILHEHLSAIAKLAPQPHCLEELLIWSQGITLALQGQIEAEELLSQLISLPETQQTPLGKQLEIVQNSFRGQSSLKQVIRELGTQGQSNSLAIAQALYCFISTPQDFRLSVSRGTKMKHQPNLTATLSGAIAGVYNSRFGIPIPWRLHYQFLTDKWEILEKVEHFLAVWLGVYQPSK